MRAPASELGWFFTMFLLRPYLVTCQEGKVKERFKVDEQLGMLSEGYWRLGHLQASPLLVQYRMPPT